MINGMSDYNVSFLIEVIQRLIPQSIQDSEIYQPTGEKTKKIQAFKELDAARAQIKRYLPDDFDPDKELEEANATFIVTRNITDFAESVVPAIEPEELLNRFK